MNTSLRRFFLRFGAAHCCAALWVWLALSAGAHAATAPASTTLSTQAYADYLDPTEVASRRVYSNTVRATVASVEAFSLSGNSSVRGEPGRQFVTPFILSNLGNVASDYTIQLNTTGCPGSTPTVTPTGLQLASDGNNDGVVKSSEVLAVPATLHLAAGESASLLVQGLLPNVSGGVACVKLSAVTSLQQVQSSASTVMTLGPSADISLTKTASYSSPVRAGASTVAFSVTAQNVGTRSALPSATVGGSSFTVDGAASTQVLLHDVIPTGTQYVVGSLQSAALGAQLLYRLAGDAAGAYRSGESASAVEVGVGVPSIAPSAGAQMRFSVAVQSSALSLSNVVNRADIDYADSGTSLQLHSNAVVVPLASQRLSLSLAAGDPVPQYSATGVSDGTAIVHFTAKVRNDGNAPLYDVQIQHLLEGGTQFGSWTSGSVPAASQYTVVSGSLKVTQLTNSTTVASAAGGFTGRSGATGLLASGAYLPVSGAITVEYDVRVNYSGRTDPVIYTSATTAAARASGGTANVTAQSVNGTEPDQFASPSSTPVTAPALLSVTATASLPRRISSNVFEYDVTVTVTNAGVATANNVRVFDNLDCALKQSTNGAVNQWTLKSAPVVSNGLLTVNSAYTGIAPCTSTATGASGGLPLRSSVSLTDGLRNLSAGQSERITYTVQAALASQPGYVVISDSVWAATFNNSGTLPQVVTAQQTSAQVLLIDPQGVVYDSVARTPIAGATVTIKRASCPNSTAGAIKASELFNGSSGAFTFNADGSASLTTGSDGGYQFFWISPPVTDNCTYTLSVTGPSSSTYVSPSQVIPAQSGTFGTCGSVVSSSSAPQGTNPTTYYLSIKSGFDSTTNSACEVLHNHIPLDPVASRTKLTLSKEANKSQAELGDFVDYKLTVTNKSGVALTGLTFTDQLPAGFAYVSGSAVFNGQRVADPSGGAGPGLSFSYPTYAFAANASVSLSYRVRIGVGAPTGNAINRAHASANGTASNEATWRVAVSGGALGDDAFLIGKVFMDCNHDGSQGGPDELGIAGVRLFLENGSSAITDAEGRYSLYGLKPVTHAIRVDASTLPAGARLQALDNRNAGSADSRFVDAKKGELAKADFIVANCETVRDEVKARREAARKAGDGLSAAVQARLTADIASTTSSTSAKAGNAANRSADATGAIGQGGAQSKSAPADQPLINLPQGLGGSTAGAAAPAARAAQSAKAPQATPAAGTEAPLPLDRLVPTLDGKPGFIGLADGQALRSRVVNVRVKGPAGSQLELAVNGTAQAASRVGTKATLESRDVSAWEYIGVELQPGRNELVLTVVKGGQPQATVQLGVTAPGRLAAIRIEPQEALRADPLKATPVIVRLLDAGGLPVAERLQITLQADNARWLADDLNPGEPGTQVFIEGGEGRFMLQPPAEPGPVRVGASAETVQQQVSLDALPAQKPLSGIGIVEGVLDLSNRGNISLGRPAAGSAFEAELSGLASEHGNGRAAARAAFYFKGMIKGEYLLTAAYDSDKTSRDRLFRDIRPDEYYPIYGDASVRGFDAQSTQKLYVRIDKERSYLLYGDFTTASSAEVRQLSQVNRTLTGLKHEYRNDSMRVTSFASRSSSTQQEEEIAATGLSVYFLSGTAEISPNSEKVEIIVRSRAQPQLVLSRKTLVRFVDYTLEPLTRRLLLVDPLPSIDADLNPQSIRVSYEAESGGPSHLVAGVDAQVKLTDAVQAGVVVTKDTNPDNANRSLKAATLLARVGESTVVAAEVVRTGSDDKGTGDAARLQVKHAQGDLKLQAEALRTSVNFDNPSASATAGRTEVLARAEYPINDQTRAKAELAFSRNDANTSTVAADRKSASVAVQRKFSDILTGELGLSHGNDSGGGAGRFDYGVLSTSSSTSSTASASGAGTSSTTVRGRLSARPASLPGAELFVEGEQDVRAHDRHALAVGGSYAVTDSTRIYAREQYMSSAQVADNALANQKQATVIGVESNYMQGGRVYNEYRASAGSRGENATGVRNTFKVGEGLRLSAGFERTQLLGSASGSSSTSATGNATAVTFGADYTGDVWRASGALEWRDGTSGSSKLLSGGVAYQVDPAWTVLARSVITETDSSGSGSHLLSRQQLGLAWRPVDNDRLNGLVRLERRDERITAGSAATSVYSLYGSSSAALPGDYRTYVFSGVANYNPERGSVLTGRYGLKYSSIDDSIAPATYWAQLAHLRYTRDIAKGWDVGVQGGLMWGKGGAQQRTLGLEVGYQLLPNLWLSSGVNVLGLKDPDLTGADYTSRGIYFRVRWKFDETGLEGLQLSRRTGAARPEAPEPVAAAASPAPAPAPEVPASQPASQPAAAPVPQAAAPQVQQLSEAVLFGAGTGSALADGGRSELQAVGQALAARHVQQVLVVLGQTDQAATADLGLWLSRGRQLRDALQASCGCEVSVEVQATAPAASMSMQADHALLSVPASTVAVVAIKEGAR